MEIKQNQYVQGYYRNKTVEEEKPKPEPNGKATFYSVVGMPLVLSWAISNPRSFAQAVLFVGACVAIGCSVSYLRTHKTERENIPHLVVNDYTGTTKTIYL